MVSSAREFGGQSHSVLHGPLLLVEADAAHQMMNECNRESHQAFDGESSDVDACLGPGDDQCDAEGGFVSSSSSRWRRRATVITYHNRAFARYQGSQP